MKKRWLILIAFLLFILIFWQMGGIEYLASRTVFAPDHDSDLIDNEDVIIFSKDIGYEVEIIGEGLEIPWEIVPLPDDKFLVTERPGRVVLLDKGEIYTVSGVEHIGEGGLLGLEISPDFQENKHVFLYYTYRSGNQIFNRLSRFTFADSTLIDEEYILNEIPGSRFHNGGRVKFGPDKKLYVTIGDAQDPNLSQNINSLAGKILRINPDGTIPGDNPFEDNPVYAYGLRNPQGLSWHPTTGELFASDHGPNSQDEINRILPGRNYGWPIVTCSAGETQFEDPIVCYSDFTMAPSGIVFLPWDDIDETPLYVAGLRGNMIMRIDLDDQGNFIRQEPIISEYGRIRTIVYKDDSLYIATNNRDGRGIPKEKDDVILKIKLIKENTSDLDSVSKELAFKYQDNKITISDIVDNKKIESILGKADEIKSHTYTKDDGLNMDQLLGRTELVYQYPGLIIKSIDGIKDNEFSVFSIEISDPKYSTVRDIKVGDSFEKLKEAYPEGKLLGGELSDSEDDYRYEPADYTEIINFRIKNKIIEKITMNKLLD